MAVFITAAGGVLGVPTEDDVSPEDCCTTECAACRAANGGGCAAQMRHLEILADAFMLEGLEAGA